jgi:hypothetical protein
VVISFGGVVHLAHWGGRACELLERYAQGRETILELVESSA